MYEKYAEAETAQAVDGRVALMADFVDLDNRLHEYRAQQRQADEDVKRTVRERDNVIAKIIETVQPSDKPMVEGSR